jgi:ectoine hydroxylase-related dioxygenase (phytanoyl-CoA dioxygenase family)
MPAAERGAKTPWHQDEPYGPFDRQGSLTVWIALVDIPPERGSLRFYSGSHRLGGLGRHLITPGFDALDEYPWIAGELELSPPLHLRPGDATVHSRATLHSAPENDTDSPRWAYQLIFFPAEALYSGTGHFEAEDAGIAVDKPFEHARFPVVYPATAH